MNTESLTKLSLSALGAYVALCLNTITAPVIILLAVMVCDYVTGLIRAYLCGTLSSKIGFRGIAKKVCYLVAVGIACVVDFLLSSGIFGTWGDVFWFTLLVIVWLILNEIISIIENLCGIGVPLPKFMRQFVKRLKTEAEDKIQNEE